MKITFVFLAVVFMWSSASAQSSGTKLLEMCQNAEKHYDKKTLTNNETLSAGMCVGFISGVMRVDMLVEQRGGKRAICAPKNSDTEQIVRVVAKWMREHPEKLHLDAVAIVGQALHSAFPCH